MTLTKELEGETASAAFEKDIASCLDLFRGQLIQQAGASDELNDLIEKLRKELAEKSEELQRRCEHMMMNHDGF